MRGDCGHALSMFAILHAEHEDYVAPLGAAIGFRRFGGGWGMPFDGHLGGALFERGCLSSSADHGFLKRRAASLVNEYLSEMRFRVWTLRVAAPWHPPDTQWFPGTTSTPS